MDMTDNQLLDQFFSEARQTTIADEGFTERVMQHIPNRKTQTLSRLWTAFCVALAVGLFVLLRGWEPIAYGLMMLANNYGQAQHHLLTFTVSVGVIGLLAVGEVLGRERYSTL